MRNKKNIKTNFLKPSGKLIKTKGREKPHLLLHGGGLGSRRRLQNQ
jgi:hypothetical protein